MHRLIGIYTLIFEILKLNLLMFKLLRCEVENSVFKRVTNLKAESRIRDYSKIFLVLKGILNVTDFITYYIRYITYYLETTL